ncbi:hypothetical protein MAQ5080_01241 [Marinomonas aquimarina]|uniref:Uncharacterized protein n=1 Tax=Marinomonas aquimarina TaxID=295068 RepID=A0A1A8TA33_9GAMM|nr:hypothetical protein [Marinomonas aquimarina]SBS28898.1 hypothetical protein MAQ5080_01241 [Marinomonas aquimarina]
MFILRGLIYLLALAGIAQCIALEAFQFGTAAEYGESSLVEHLQDLFTFSSALTFMVCAYLSKPLRQACILLGALMFMMFVRESDSLLDAQVFDGAWQLIVGAVIIATVYGLRNQVKDSYDSLKRFSQTSSFGFVVAGLVVVLAFSRMFGRTSFWQSVMGDAYVRTVKNIVEEGTELLGYSIVMIAATELLFFVLAVAKERKHVQASAKASYAKAELAR